MEEKYGVPEHPASLGGIDKFYKALDKKIPKKQIAEYLQGVDAYTLHKPARTKFPTNRVIVYGMNAQFQADLVDVRNLKRYNDGYQYILTCIDVFSKYAWAIALKQKRGVDITQAFEKIFSERLPKALQTDAGTEFKNTTFQKFLKDRHVRFFTTFNNTKASVVERFNRTLRNKMWAYFTYTNTYRYIDVLEKLLLSYNYTFHTSIKRTPADVNATNESEVWYTLYGDESVDEEPCVFSPGDIVRISKRKLTFEKGYEKSWTEELFKVVECVKRAHPVYRISDLLDEPILGTFYKYELQKVKMKEDFPIEKILKKRTRKKRLEYFVKYRGYSEKFNQWVPGSHLSNL